MRVVTSLFTGPTTDFRLLMRFSVRSHHIVVLLRLLLHDLALVGRYHVSLFDEDLLGAEASWALLCYYHSQIAGSLATGPLRQATGPPRFGAGGGSRNVEGWREFTSKILKIVFTGIFINFRCPSSHNLIKVRCLIFSKRYIDFLEQQNC